MPVQKYDRTIIAAMILAFATLAHAQIKNGDAKDANTTGPRLDKQLTQWIEIGMTVKAVGGPIGGIIGTTPVPIDWPEQKVSIVDEKISTQGKRVTYKTISGTVKQMRVEIPFLPAGREATVLITFEVIRSSLLAPETTDIYKIPEKPNIQLRRYLGPSPYINSRHSKIKKLAKQIAPEETNAWKKAEAMYDWVRDHVEYKNGKLKGAVKALTDGYGDCEELSSLFIALCRANKIPARIVWIPGHCYPEFYLVDDENKGHWFPCQAAGTRAFGSMPDHRPILQKGDNFRHTDRPGKKLHYVSEFLKGNMKRGSGKPQVTFIRRMVPVKKG